MCVQPCRQRHWPCRQYACTCTVCLHLQYACNPPATDCTLLPRAVAVSCSTDGLAQQFLTNLAKLKASKDCVLGLAATLSLWYLSAEDANPCYLASVAAAVLVDQLLQVRHGQGGLTACISTVVVCGTVLRDISTLLPGRPGCLLQNCSATHS